VEEKKRTDQATCALLSQQVERLHLQLAKAGEEAAVDPLKKVANRRLAHSNSF